MFKECKKMENSASPASLIRGPITVYNEPAKATNPRSLCYPRVQPDTVNNTSRFNSQITDCVTAMMRILREIYGIVIGCAGTENYM